MNVTATTAHETPLRSLTKARTYSLGGRLAVVYYLFLFLLTTTVAAAAIIILEPCHGVLIQHQQGRRHHHKHRFAYGLAATTSSSPGAPQPSRMSSDRNDEQQEEQQLFVGLDLGTSGARITVVDRTTREVFATCTSWTTSTAVREGRYDDPYAWWRAVTHLFNAASAEVDLKGHCQAICVSGTSASCLLVDSRSLKVLERPRMYNYHVIQSSDVPASGVVALERIRGTVPPRHTVQSPTSALAKLLSWGQARTLGTDLAALRLVHQADYLSLRAMGSSTENRPPCGTAAARQWGWSTVFPSDFHNCLKLGYNPATQSWPGWMEPLLQSVGLTMQVLPSPVVSPGIPIGTVDPSVAREWGIREGTVVCGGTTDSNAAFLAAAGLCPVPGTAVTSLGSTVVLKQLSRVPVEDAALGVYSHALPTPIKVIESSSSSSSSSASASPDSEDEQWWLVGGASNVGCAVLRQQGFTTDELIELSASMDPTTDSQYDYYPLVSIGERFPVADASKAPVLDPKPDSRSEYLKGLLQGIARVEAQGYQTLRHLGAEPAPRIVQTAGGGSGNEMWTVLRQRLLTDALRGRSGTGFDDNEDNATVVVQRADHTEASYGAALLAASTFINTD